MPVCWEIPFMAKISQKTRESVFYTRTWTSGLTAGRLESLLGSLWEQITSRCLIIWGQLLEISLEAILKDVFSVFGHETFKCVERSRHIPKLWVLVFLSSSTSLNVEFMFLCCCDDEGTCGLAILHLSYGKFMEEVAILLSLSRKWLIYLRTDKDLFF